MNYRLQFFDESKNQLALVMKHHSERDFYVRAIKETTDINLHNRTHYLTATYSRPYYSLDQARSFIHTAELDIVRDCLGLCLEDTIFHIPEYVPFEPPILIRTIPQSTVVGADNAAAIRYGAWHEGMMQVLTVVWGEERAKLKIKEYRPPRE